MSMTNKQIAKPLKETSALIELTGGNPFRARAFASAARTIERLEVPVADLLASGELTGIKGIGKGLASQIEEILAYGSFEVRDSILGALPPGLLDVLSVKGLGAKKARALWQNLGVQSLDDLEAAAQSGRIAELDGFGAKSQDSILSGIALLRSFMGKRRQADARGAASDIMAALEQRPDVSRVAWSGELALGRNEVGELSFVVAHDGSSSPLPDWPLEQDGADWTGTMEDGLSVRIRTASAADFARVVVEETGPQSFADAILPQLPSEAGAEDERGLFEKAGLPYIVPELRDLPEAAGRLADLSNLELITDEDLHGVLHNHSTYSDGAHTLKQMGDAVRERGFSYFGICDHSQSLKVASGMSPETALKQKAEIAELNAAYAADGGPEFKIFFGVESDILADGSLDYEDEILATFDMIVASVHVGFNMTEKEATDRLVRAIENPYTTILGHPTGRLILRRDGYPVDHETVLQACAQNNVAVELNANPYRLDLDWRWIERARELSVPVSINPDAHSIEQIDLMTWGVLAARKGGLTAPECLNALPLDQFESWLKNRR